MLTLFSSNQAAVYDSPFPPPFRYPLDDEVILVGVMIDLRCICRPRPKRVDTMLLHRETMLQSFNQFS